MEQSANIKQVTPFFMVTSMEASLRFYVEGLGFTLKNSWSPRGSIEWCWLEREGASLMLQEYRPNNPNIQAVKGVGVSLCFQCVDALALYHEFLAKGITLREPFVGNNMWDVALTDPDNYSIHFESPTDVPEETTYSAWREQNK